MIARILTAALILTSGATLSQIPEFAQQYRQRIGGAVDELNSFVQRFDEDARSQNLTREQALAKHLAATDDLFRQRGLSMQETIRRRDRLAAQQQTMQVDSAFVRIISLATSADRPLAKRTLEIYEPALPITAEGGVMALFGGLLGWLVARLLGAPKRMLDRRLAAHRQYEA